MGTRPRRVDMNTEAEPDADILTGKSQKHKQKSQKAVEERKKAAPEIEGGGPRSMAGALPHVRHGLSVS